MLIVVIGRIQAHQPRVVAPRDGILNKRSVDEVLYLLPKTLSRNLLSVRIPSFAFFSI